MNRIMLLGLLVCISRVALCGVMGVMAETVARRAGSSSLRGLCRLCVVAYALVLVASFAPMDSAQTVVHRAVPLLFAPYFKNAIETAEKSWRNVVTQAALNGLPTPAFASSLSYFDGLRSKRLPAALIQGQRDYFGAHTYQRVDQPGAFHTLWAEPGREEIEA